VSTRPSIDPSNQLADDRHGGHRADAPRTQDETGGNGRVVRTGTRTAAARITVTSGRITLFGGGGDGSFGGKVAIWRLGNPDEPNGPELLAPLVIVAAEVVPARYPGSAFAAVTAAVKHAMPSTEDLSGVRISHLQLCAGRSRFPGGS
jgi:hypothetical protein